jgi:hypothetical protein
MGAHVVVAIWLIAHGDGVAFIAVGQDVPALSLHSVYPPVITVNNPIIFIRLAKGCGAKRI